MDETLRQWGRNIATFRALHKPDGELRTSADEEQMGQADLGALLDPAVTQATVSRWESGRMEPRRQYKTQLAGIFRVDVDTVFPLTKVPA